MEEIKTIGQPNHEGYVNVASQLGLSGQRGIFLDPFLCLKITPRLIAFYQL